VLKTVLAENDLEEIWFYIALDNTEAADALLDKIDKQITSSPEIRNSVEHVPSSWRNCTAFHLETTFSTIDRWTTESRSSVSCTERGICRANSPKRSPADKPARASPGLVGIAVNDQNRARALRVSRASSGKPLRTRTEERIRLCGGHAGIENRKGATRGRPFLAGSNRHALP
jgi:hypothetical protein